MGATPFYVWGDKQHRNSVPEGRALKREFLEVAIIYLLPKEKIIVIFNFFVYLHVGWYR